MIELVSHPEGVILPVLARPGARSSGLKGDQDGRLKVGVTQIAEKGKANKAIQALLVKKLGLRNSQVELIAGETSSRKKFLVRGVTLEELRGRIEAAGG